MGHYAVALVAGILMLSAVAAGADLSERLRSLPDHPRLFPEVRDREALRARVAADPLLSRSRDYILKAADAILEAEPVVYKKKGRRLLMVSRTCLKRVTHLAMAHLLTGRPEYAQRAQREMLAAAEFKNWNASHFLDVAEMTTALAIGYDWLHGELTPQAREAIRKAIINKGLKPGMRGGWWVKAHNNWGQVCHGGLTLGALIVGDEEPELARKVIERAAKRIAAPMRRCAPDGAYPEGAGYWEYGTSYNVLFLAAVESALDTNFGLLEIPGFLESSDYFQQVAGPSGRFFNYADSGQYEGVTPAMYWFAARRDKPSLLWRERRNLEDFFDKDHDLTSRRDRFFPFLLVWAPSIDDVPAPEVRHWRGDGPNPVGLHRTAWGDPQAVFVGIKGGSPSVNHGHMDVGSFVIEADGVRWALDLGKQSYTPLEKAGIKLWNRKQRSGRWDVFRLSNYSHNTLVVDGKKQRVDGHSPITGFSADAPMPHTIVDIADAYDGQLAAAKRGAGLRPDGSILIQDELQAPDRKVTVRWGMVTKADVALHGTWARLRQDGSERVLRLLGPADAELALYETAEPPRDYDEPNPGTKMIGFTVEIPASSRQTLAVLLAPSEDAECELKPLEQW